MPADGVFVPIGGVTVRVAGAIMAVREAADNAWRAVCMPSRGVDMLEHPAAGARAYANRRCRW
jgi:hypothetical protein